MLDETIEKKLEQRLVKRMQDANVYVIKQIANTLKEIRQVTPSQATKLVNVLKYGGNYNKIVKKLAEYTKLNIKDIDKIFQKVAKENQLFAKQFYEYRNKQYIPYSKNKDLQNEVKAISNITKKEMLNMSNTYGFQKIENDKRINTTLSTYYQEVIDRGIMSIQQGKESFNQEVTRIVKELTDSGLRTIDFDSGYSRRVDSQVRMNLKDGLRRLNQEMYLNFGKEFGADGVEVSVHDIPAPDHAYVQGRQFTSVEFEKFQNDEDCVDIDGMKFTSEFEGHDRRSIGQYNCYHDIFPIIIGVSKKRYSNEQLQSIIDNSNKVIEFEGKKYTMYDVTQLQRKLETEIRKNKDLYIASKDLDENTMLQAEYKVRLYENKYFNLSKISKLEPDLQRINVSGYKYTKLTETQENKLKTYEKQVKTRIEKQKDVQLSSSNAKNNKYYNENEYFYMQVGDLSERNVDVSSEIINVDTNIREKCLDKLIELVDKYPHDKYINKPLTINYKKLGENTYASSWIQNHSINLNNLWYDDYDKFFKARKRNIETNWSPKGISDENVIVSNFVHEYGHTIEDNYLQRLKDTAIRNNKSFNWDKADFELRDIIKKKTERIAGQKMDLTYFKFKYYTRYAMSKRHYEWFADGFCQLELGEQNAFTEAIKEWLEEFYK